MVKRILACLLTALLLIGMIPAAAELNVERNEGELFFPEEKNWVYHFAYAYPRIQGEDYTAALINDTYQMALNEMTQLVLPMFANAPDMRFDGKNEVVHDFAVFCNNDRLLSIVQTRLQTMGEDGSMFSLEPLTFDISGMYAGETLTLRGVLLIQAGVDAERIEEATAEEYPQIAHILSGSSSSIGDTLLPRLYERFCQADWAASEMKACSLEDFELEFSPARDFAADADGNIVFLFPPMLLTDPDVKTLTLTISEIEALLAEAL